MNDRRVPVLEGFAVAALLALAAWLRLRDAAFIAFNRDAGLLVGMADRLRAGEHIFVGIPSSKGLVNPPLAVYLVAALETFSRSPAAITTAQALMQIAAIALTWWLVRARFGGAIALASTAFFAASGWAVLYARILWPPCLAPLFAVAMLGSLWAWAVDRKPFALALALPLAAVAAQLHLTGFAWFALVAAVGVLLRPPLDRRAAAIGAAGAVALLVPYAIGLATAGAASGTQRRALFVDFIGSPIRFFLLSATHGGVDYHFPTLDAALAERAIPPIGLLYSIVPWIGAAGVLVGAWTCAPRAREIVVERGFPWIRWSGDATRATLFLFAAVPVFAMTFAGLDTSSHYLLLEYPAAFVFLALSLRVVSTRVRRGVLTAVVVAIFFVVNGLSFSLVLQDWIRTRPSWNWSAGYSTPLGDQQAAIDWIVQDAGASPVRLMTTPFPKAPAKPPMNFVLLLDHARGTITRPADLEKPVTPFEKRYLIADEGNGGLSEAAVDALRRRGAHNFGELWVCEW